MYYLNQYIRDDGMAFKSRVLNANNSNEGIYIPENSNLRQQLKRLQSRARYSKEKGIEDTELLRIVEDIKNAIKQGLN